MCETGPLGGWACGGYRYIRWYIAAWNELGWEWLLIVLKQFFPNYIPERGILCAESFRPAVLTAKKEGWRGVNITSDVISVHWFYEGAVFTNLAPMWNV